MSSDSLEFPEHSELAIAVASPADRFSIGCGMLDELLLLDRHNAARYALISLWWVGRDHFLGHLKNLADIVMRVRGRKVDAATLKGCHNVQAAAISCINAADRVGSQSPLLLLGFEEVPSQGGLGLDFHSRHFLGIYNRGSTSIVVAEESDRAFTDLIPNDVESMYCLRGGRSLIGATNVA